MECPEQGTEPSEGGCEPEARVMRPGWSGACGSAHGALRAVLSRRFGVQVLAVFLPRLLSSLHHEKQGWQPELLHG